MLWLLRSIEKVGFNNAWKNIIARFYSDEISYLNLRESAKVTSFIKPFPYDFHLLLSWNDSIVSSIQTVTTDLLITCHSWWLDNCWVAIFDNKVIIDNLMLRIRYDISFIWIVDYWMHSLSKSLIWNLIDLALISLYVLVSYELWSIIYASLRLNWNLLWIIQRLRQYWILNTLGCWLRLNLLS